MSISAFGAIFIPAALWIFFFRPQYLVSLTVVASVFAAASVLNFSLGDSDFGVQPYYFALGLLAIRALPALFRYRRFQREARPVASAVVGSLSRFWKWAILSSLVLPIVFRGIQVISPRSGAGDAALAFALEGATNPLHWGLENLGQAAYLTLNFIALLYVFRFGQTTDASRRSLRALRVSIVIVSVIAIAQSVAVWTNQNFPYWFFNGNPAYSQAYDAAVGGVQKVSSTFTEASYAGGFLAAGALGFLAARLRGQENTWAVVLAVLGLLLTTATTGYATFLIGGAVLFWYFVREGFRRRLSARFLWGCASAVLFVAGAVTVVLFVDVPLRQAVLAATINKVDTLSFVVRTSIDLYSMRLLANTYGLGVGLGSNRPSGLATYLLSNVGLIGSLLFVIFIARLMAWLLRACRERVRACDTVLWMLAGLLIAQGVGLPDLSWPPLWAVLLTAGSVLLSRAGPARTGTYAVEPAAGANHLPASAVG